MQAYNLDIDTEATTAPPSDPGRWTPVDQARALRGRRARREHLALFAVSLPLGALVIGIAAGAIAAVAF